VYSYGWRRGPDGAEHGDVSRWTAAESRLRRPARMMGGNAYLASAALRILLTGSLDEVRGER
jgi:hypothetical protein